MSTQKPNKREEDVAIAALVIYEYSGEWESINAAILLMLKNKILNRLSWH